VARLANSSRAGQPSIAQAEATQLATPCGLEAKQGAGCSRAGWPWSLKGDDAACGGSITAAVSSSLLARTCHTRAIGRPRQARHAAAGQHAHARPALQQRAHGALQQRARRHQAGHARTAGRRRREGVCAALVHLPPRSPMRSRRGRRERAQGSLVFERSERARARASSGNSGSRLTCTMPKQACGLKCVWQRYDMPDACPAMSMRERTGRVGAAGQLMHVVRASVQQVCKEVLVQRRRCGV